MSKSARDVAVEALALWEREHTYSNIMLDHMLENEKLSEVEAAFATRLIYGVIERCLTIDWLLAKNSRQPLKKCHPTVRAILRVAVYQLLYMEKIPSSAAVNEAVTQTKRMKQSYASGFVNGVLRAVLREGEKLLKSLPLDLKGHSIRHSIPLALLKAWEKAYGRETALLLAGAANDAPPSCIRVNTLKTDMTSFELRLLAENVAFKGVPSLSGAYIVEDAAALRRSAVEKNLYYFQDIASQWACAMLGARSRDRVLDVCAAPGGKSFTTAMYMNGEGELVSCDVYAEKTAVIAARAAELGIGTLKTICRDASSACPKEWESSFDRVICDVPCSGFGVIRRRPEIRYKDLAEFADLPALQYTILCEAAKAVKPGGILQYSTCTLRPEENEQVSERFLREHPEFMGHLLPASVLFETAGLPISYCITLMPHIHGSDGFFIASFRKGETA